MNREVSKSGKGYSFSNISLSLAFSKFKLIYWSKSFENISIAVVFPTCRAPLITNGLRFDFADHFFNSCKISLLNT